MASVIDRKTKAAASVPAHLRPALKHLLQAHEYACHLAREPWDLAVEISTLRRLGLTNTDLRWLVCRGYVAHAREITMLGEDGRKFQTSGDLTFTKRTCVVLTDLGVNACRSMATNATANAIASEAQGWPVATGSYLPRWDHQRHEFRVGDDLVKQFKLPSANQEAILSAFQEEGWPPRIDDPLPPHPELDPKRRLHDSIKSLNRNQKVNLIQFRGDGTGEGICWDLVTPADTSTSAPMSASELNH